MKPLIPYLRDQGFSYFCTMNFEELDLILEHSLSEDNVTAPTPEEDKLIKKIKQGGNNLVFAGSREAMDKVLFFTSLIKAPKAFEGAPRVLWITTNNTRAIELAKTLRNWIRRSEIAIELANDSGKIIEQRNHIFEGADIIIGTPRRVLELYNQNGFHINQLSLVIIDEVDELCKNPTLIQHVRRVNESVEKCQKLLVSYGDHERLDTFANDICYRFDTITF